MFLIRNRAVGYLVCLVLVCSFAQCKKASIPSLKVEETTCLAQSKDLPYEDFPIGKIGPTIDGAEQPFRRSLIDCFYTIESACFWLMKHNPGASFADEQVVSSVEGSNVESFVVSNPGPYVIAANEYSYLMNEGYKHIFFSRHVSYKTPISVLAGYSGGKKMGPKGSYLARRIIMAVRGIPESDFKANAEGRSTLKRQLMGRLLNLKSAISNFSISRTDAAKQRIQAMINNARNRQNELLFSILDGSYERTAVVTDDLDNFFTEWDFSADMEYQTGFENVAWQLREWEKIVEIGRKWELSQGN